ncbi:MAG TPA: penicillin-binding protein 2 [Terracidiphilus sp.]|jgi:penicillin-binding protein 2|nr:penicillin-binding protein 2 [Terracidiphilus sp.]
MIYDKVTRGEKLPALKFAVVQYAILALILALSAGLWRLQILGAHNFRMLAEQNRIRKVPILAPRGKLFDRENRLVVDNYPSVSCFLVREQNRNVDADLPMIARGLHLDLDQLKATLHKYRLSPGYQPIPIKEDVTADEQAFIEAHRNELPELETIEGERRLYPRDGYASHLIGYVGEVSEEDLNQTRYAAYEPGDVVGKGGVEEMYDQVLRGQDGSRDVIVDSHGREVGFLGIQHAVPGQDLKLTIDNDLQKAAELALGDRTGAIVAMDPRNGEILAMVSRPSFDPNLFAVKIDRGEWNKLITDPDHPLMNKAIQAQLAPGSTFKILMSVAGLQEGLAQNMHVNCAGGWGPYGYFHHCDEKHGAVDIHNAIPFSCDTFYYQLGDKLGIDRIAKYASAFGYGQKTGIDLPGEQAGLMPSQRWLMKNYHRRWYPDETLDVAIGQGAVAATPLQLARIIGGIASEGHLVRPHVVAPDQLPAEFRKDLYESLEGTGDATLPIDPDNWQTITDGMAAVTQPGYFHTAGSAHLEGIDLAGKTGTAQVMSHEALGKTNKGHHTLPNVWFVGVVPRRNPELVIAVLWEHGEFSYYPARLGARLVAAYVEKQRRLQNNLMPVKAPNPKPVEVGAVWTAPNPSAGVQGEPPTKMQAGKFYVGAKGAVTGTSEGNSTTALKAAPSVPAAPKNATRSSIRNPIAASSSANVKSGKPAQGPSESARLSSQPALPGKSTQVKSQ